MTRLISDTPLTPEAFHDEARRRGRIIGSYRKLGFFAARPSPGGQVVETAWNGRAMQSVLRNGDVVLTAVAEDGAPLVGSDGRPNTLSLRRDRFEELFEVEPAAAPNAETDAAVYRSASVIEAFYLPGGFDIAAPWGGRQTARRGYLLAEDGVVFGCRAATFKQVYRKER